MKIDLIEITPDYCVENDGLYLVRTKSVYNLPGLRKFRYLEARVHKHFDEKKNKFIMKIDISNQIATHISKEQLV